MTKQRDFKALVRERMAKTGERYAAARARVIRETSTQGQSPQLRPRLYPGVLDGYDAFGGIQSGTAPVTNVLRHAGATWSATGAPFTESTVNGLCGGAGFLYAVFEYKGWPPLLSIALQSRSMPDAYIGGGLARLGVKTTKSETTSAGAARKVLDATLGAGKPALCTTGLRTVAVVGRDGDDHWVDGRAPVPTRLPSERLARLRGGYKATKNRLVSIDESDPSADALATLRHAIAETATSYVEPPVPKSFQVNCGFAGLEKWQRMLTDRKDRKAWPTLFAEGPRAFAALKRTYEWVACFVAPGAGRPLYAEFLDDAARILAQPALRTSASAFRDAGQRWSDLASFIATIDDAAVRRACEAAEHAIEALDDEGDCHTVEDPMELAQKQRVAGLDCTLTKEAALAIYAEMATRVGAIAEAERAAVVEMAAIGRAVTGRSAPRRT